jgi:hypothetical protein
MTNRLLTLGACIAVVLATAAGPALADGQSATGSLVTVQVGSASVSPDTAVSAPVDVESPVCAVAVCDNGSASQSSSAATATGGSGAGQAPATQSATGSAGTGQVGAASVAPATAVDAPVTADAPVCVLAACRHRGAGGQVAESEAASKNHATSNGPDGAGSQSAHHSAGTVQVESVDVSPATAVSAPADANVPVCIAAACSPGQAPGTAGLAEATKPSTGSGTPGQSADGSVGTVQVGSVDVGPGTAVSAPVGANAPVCVVASCYETTPGTTTVTNTGVNPPLGNSPKPGAGGQTVPAGTPTGQPAPVGTPAGQPATAAPQVAPPPAKGGPPTRHGVAGGKHTFTGSPDSGTARAAKEALKSTLPFTGLALGTCAALALIVIAVGTAARSVLIA